MPGQEKRASTRAGLRGSERRRCAVLMNDSISDWARGRAGGFGGGAGTVAGDDG